MALKLESKTLSELSKTACRGSLKTQTGMKSLIYMKMTDGKDLDRGELAKACNLGCVAVCDYLKREPKLDMRLAEKIRQCRWTSSYACSKGQQAFGATLRSCLMFGNQACFSNGYSKQFAFLWCQGRDQINDEKSRSYLNKLCKAYGY